MIESISAKCFNIQELVPQTVYDARGQKAWQLIDNRLIENLDSLRKQLGVPMTCNNWYTGGNRSQSGLRIVGQPYYKPFSQHSFGRAADLVCSIDAKEVRRRLREKVIVLPHPCVIEEFDSKGEEISWIHLDVRNQTDHLYFMRA